MTRYLRAVAATILVTALTGLLQLGWFSGAAAAATIMPTFDSLAPAPFTTVAPGKVQIRVSAHSDTAITQIQFKVAGQEFGGPDSTLTGDVVLDPGVYTVLAVAVDTDGDRFQAMWDFIVSNNLGDGEWFTANGTPKADQINATMTSLVQAFRWHLFGQSWDGSNHSDLPSHVGFQGTGDPVGPWVTGTTFDQAQTSATLRSLVEAFRWHFWGVSWDGANHPDVPTHASTVQPPQSIDPWFTTDGHPFPANITATLRSLVEAFRWHFWGYSWGGSNHPDMPTHASFGGATPGQSYPTEGNVLNQSTLTEIPQSNLPSGLSGAPTADGYALTTPPGQYNPIINYGWVYGDASFSVTLRAVSPNGQTAGCVLIREVENPDGASTYADCLVLGGNGMASGNEMRLLKTSSDSSTPSIGTAGQFALDPSLKSTDWNTIKVIAQGDRFWFFVNGSYLGTVTHSGTMSGSVGFGMLNMDQSNAQSIEFKDLTVRALQ